MTSIVITDYFSAELQAQKHQATGEKMAAYMKDKFPFYGVNAPSRREIVTRLWKTEKKLIQDEVWPIVNYLWTKPQREYQMIAIDILGRCKRQFSKEALPLFEQLITTKSWWDTVDFLASTNVGEILKDDPPAAQSIARKYMGGENMWLKRTALIFQLKYKDNTDKGLLYDLIDETKGSKEFFINKASGWALRQYSKFNNESVREYIRANEGTLSSLTKREGSKYL